MPRPRKSVEERVAEIDAKIEKKKAELAALEEKKSRIQNPITAQMIIKKAKESGMSLAEMMDKLGIEP